ncbi:metal-dependent hydrolase [Aureibaculum sp. 2210JD6-5]|uniref:metal-dependent hydrolase n=1 Tax=Aureibaculum sp. 2210JD6-5 TaxID=3103957 RepID=UPI002AAF055D|nr:metal-dependent hydrolase [Aureibaculum sp. 2210JD6-5]MDY7396964.1 metal-dependent hydrolase [Aureibaculum sp. 2210JD6-5]
MTAPNHLAGGIVITGIFCSLWNTNIFENPIFITATIIGSLLPDIDHTKSIIGKCVYPLAKWISVKYGHRTITHSAIFLLSITAIIYMLEHFQLIESDNHQLSLIVFFAIFSHFLLDMFTIQGIPLFYPFYRNPCVIPANVELRIRTGNMKQEGIVLFIFSLSTIFLQDLFKDGFWFTYNKKFNDITHLHREFENSNILLDVTYDFNVFQNNYQGTGYLIYADLFQCYILGDTLIHLSDNGQGQIINSLTPKKTKEVLSVNTINFDNISIDSLNNILSNKFIAEGKIFANQQVEVITKEKLNRATYFDIQNEYNLHFVSSYIDSLNHKLELQITELQYKIELEEDNLQYSNFKYYHSISKLKLLRNKLQSDSLNSFEYNQTQNQIIKLESYLESAFPKRSKTLIKLNDELEILQNKEVNPNIYFSGEILFFKLPIP